MSSFERRLAKAESEHARKTPQPPALQLMTYFLRLVEAQNFGGPHQEDDSVAEAWFRAVGCDSLEWREAVKNPSPSFQAREQALREKTADKFGLLQAKNYQEYHDVLRRMYESLSDRYKSHLADEAEEHAKCGPLPSWYLYCVNPA